MSRQAVLAQRFPAASYALSPCSRALLRPLVLSLAMFQRFQLFSRSLARSLSCSLALSRSCSPSLPLARSCSPSPPLSRCLERRVEKAVRWAKKEKKSNFEERVSRKLCSNIKLGFLKRLKTVSLFESLRLKMTSKK